MLFWSRIKVIFGASALATACACHSAKSSIDNLAKDINADANKTMIIAQEIGNSSTQPENISRSKDIVNIQKDIIESASEIRTDLHGVKDITPWWASMLQQLSVAAIIVATIVLLWQTGIGMFVKKIFWSVGLFIPKRAMRSAEVDLKATDENHPLSYRESIAVRRTSDSAYEYARKKLQKEK
jgi:hypothetical protein|tara:strand:+ start:1136 stop:1684 length:549 start_codon:yes stop_codon:yes gene_type:complete